MIDRKTLRGLTGAAVAAAIGLVAFAAGPADAGSFAKSVSPASGAPASARAAGCHVGGLTDHGDNTHSGTVYGGGWIACKGKRMMRAMITVRLYRDGKAIATHVKEATWGSPPHQGFSTSVKHGASSRTHTWKTKVSASWVDFTSGSHRKSLWANSIRY